MAPPNQNNRDPSPSETSYVNMSTTETKDAVGGDATLIGKHCEFAYCNQLDFLPFFCQSCRHTFCLDHRSETAHQCTEAGAWAERKRQAQLARPSAGAGKVMRELGGAYEKPCADDNCKTIVGTGLVPGVHCPGCNRTYCLKHRLREEHDCKNKTPLGARPANGAEQAATAVAKEAKNALERFKLWTKSATKSAGRSLPKPKPSSTSARLVAVNNLKKVAKGDDKLAPEKRVYLYVEAEAETAKAKYPKGEFFYNKDWVVGRVLDAAAKSLQVQNINNQSSREEDKLRVFHVEGGRLLEFNEKIGTAVVSGNTITLLRGIGPPVPDLIQT